MNLLVIRGDLQSHSGYSAAARDYCRLLQAFFDRLVGVDIHWSPERPYERFAFPIVAEDGRSGNDVQGAVIFEIGKREPRS